ncbi:Meiosis-specific nuclear structural protein 1 [Durusdinium trenchii]|uniref:Meiosis-specific nuclear structural protein 1 n=1 Tax=Durusdinium trenchii TaxID=1381693 RepID=A0ABP0P240_9DINO
MSTFAQTSGVKLILFNSDVWKHFVWARREQEAKTAELKQRLVENNIYAGYGKSELNVEKKRRALSEGAERRELLTDYSYVKSEQDKIRRAQISMLEEQLADELSKRKAETMRHEMDRRRICDGSEELRALKERLHMAKVNKEEWDVDVRKEKHRLADHSLAEHMENERLEQQDESHGDGKKANQEKIEADERAENERIEQFARDKREREENELEILRNELHFEELQAEARRLDEMRMRKKLEDREEMKNAYLVQMRRKEEKMMRAREDEAKMRDELMKKFAEDDRLEQMAEHKRRMKVEQHKREAERLVELRREMFHGQQGALVG